MKRVHIEFQRVQTWVFAAPRLRAMVGANALLGETLRIDLPTLACGSCAWNLQALADASEYPSAFRDDPLCDHDDPQSDAKNGIISRDGGHFEAQFGSGADEFAEAARRLIQEMLPGLRFRITINGQELPKGQVHLSTELPVLEPCEWTGANLASAIVAQGDDHAAVSLDVQQRHEAARKSEDREAKDLASLLITQTNLDKCKRPQDLNELTGEGYLALIQADGNGVGAAAKGHTDADRARLFHRNRVLLRRALKKAIDAHCPTSGNTPLIPLMLGGDDLLVVCRADVALPFVVTLCREPDTLQSGQSNTFNLTLGIGVVFAKANVPIYRLHEVAEQLASSAKRRFRGLQAAGQPSRSVVD